MISKDEVIKLYRKGNSVLDIAKHFNASAAIILDILNEEGYDSTSWRD